VLGEPGVAAGVAALVLVAGGSWVGSLTEWALDNPGHPDAAEAREAARRHRDGWLRGYRDVLGFVTLVLRRG
jgi:hypothetical protein